LFDWIGHQRPLTTLLLIKHRSKYIDISQGTIAKIILSNSWEVSVMRWIIRQWLVALLMLMPWAVMAQSPSPAATSSEQLLKSEELDALLAPIALYPDTLLAEVLMASTYPLDVVQAERWATENKALKGDQLKEAVSKQQWDDSEGARRNALRTYDDEHEARLDTEVGRCGSGAAG
jgi:hypothetical protein